MVSYPVKVIGGIIWSSVKEQGRLWGKGFAETVGALVTIFVTDNILSFTYKPYYQPTVYIVGIVAMLIIAYSRRKSWGRGLRKAILQTGAWLSGVVVVVLLQFARNDITYFDSSGLSAYNLLVAVALILLLLFPCIFMITSDLLRHMPSRIEAASQKRIPTIFNPDYVVKDPNQSLFDRVVSLI